MEGSLHSKTRHGITLKYNYYFTTSSIVYDNLNAVVSVVKVHINISPRIMHQWRYQPSVELFLINPAFFSDGQLFFFLPPIV